MIGSKKRGKTTFTMERVKAIQTASVKPVPLHVFDKYGEWGAGKLPPMDDFTPRTSDDEDSEPEPPLGRVRDWTTVTIDLGDGDGPQAYRREVNTMPNWAGSCWYELRYCDPSNDDAFVDPENERYWMGPQSEGDCGPIQ